MSSMTVVVVDDGGHRGAVRALVASWTRAGIVGPSLWVSPAQVVEDMNAPPRVMATLMDASGSREVDLFEHVGRYRLETLRVVVGHLVVGDDDVTGEVAHAGNVVAESLEAVLPRAVDATRPAVRLHRSVLVVPATGVGEVDRAVLRAGWEVNAVISPEDRPDLDRSDVYVRTATNYHGHAAAVLCAVGGLLRGAPEGALDGVVADSTTNDSEAVVARVTVRTVIGEDVIDVLARTVLDPASLEPEGPAQVVAWGVPVARPDLVVDKALAHLLEVPGWAQSAPPTRQAVGTTRRRFLQAVRDAARFNARTFGAVPSWLLGRGRTVLESQLRDALVGEDSGVLVDIGPRVLDDPRRAATLALQKERERLRRDTSIEANRAQAPQAVTWTALRTLALGLVDGGPLGELDEPRNLGRREVLAPGDVVVVPGEVWRDDVGTAAADDPAAMRVHARDLGALVAEHEAHAVAARAALDEALAKAEKRAEAARRRRARTASQDDETTQKTADDEESEDAPVDEPADDPTAEPADDATAEPAGGSSDDEPVDASPSDVEADRGVVRAREVLRRAEAELAIAEERRDRYEEWFAEQSRALLWRLGDDVGSRARTYRERVQAIEKRTADPVAPAAERLAAARRRLVGVWVGVLVGWLVAVGATVFLTWRSVEPDWAQAAIWAGAFTILAPLLLALANHRLYRQVLAYEHLLQQQIVGLRNDVAEYVFSGQEASRLEALCSALKDWVGILGEVVRRPWQAPALAFEDVPDEVVDAFPAAMGVARQPEDTPLPLEVRTAAYRLVYPQGWAARAFVRAYEEFESELPSATEGHLEVDLDVTGASVGARARLREFWASGRARATLSDIQLGVVRDAVASGELTLPTRVVGRVGRYSDGLQVVEPEFFRAVASEVTAFASHVFSPAGMQSRRHYVVRSVVWMPRSARGADEAQRGDPVEVRPCTGPTAVRVDLSGRVSLHELGIFAARPAVAATTQSAPALVATEPEGEEAWY